MEREMQQVIGTAPMALGKNPGENPIVNFVADLQRTAASAYFKGEPIALGVMSNGGMRNALPAGPITLGNVFELMPFENELVVLDAPGPVVQQLFDYAAPIHMAISGATYTVGPDNKPQAIRIGGQPLDPAKDLRHRHLRLPGRRRRPHGFLHGRSAAPHWPAAAHRHRGPH
ncbi:MAG: 5'-nucleotidase [Hymenobacter sp.]